MNNISLRQSHAALDMRSRRAKARKIEAILSTKLKLTDARVLDVGAGSGIIANHMSQCVGPGGEVVAVDVMDQRQIRRGFHFVQVTDTWLPFEAMRIMADVESVSLPERLVLNAPKSFLQLLYPIIPTNEH